MKTCTKCKVEKDEALFNKNRCKKDGLRGRCKCCTREYELNYRLNENNKEKKKKRNAIYYENNKEKAKEYNANNKDKIKKQYAVHRDNLSGCYVARVIKQRTTLKTKDIPIELIAAKRMQMMINRKLKELRE